MTNTFQKRFRCKSCNRYLHRYGKTASGTSRFRCSNCGNTQISYQKKRPSKRPYFQLFKEYVLDGVTYQYLAKKNRVSKQTLANWFHRYLTQVPPSLPLPSLDRDNIYLIIDGKWNGKRDVTMIYRRSDTKILLHISVMKKEYASLIKKDLLLLVEKGLVFSGVVSDGGTGITKAVSQVFPFIPHQRCLAHVHRQYSACLGQRPKDLSLQELKGLVDHLFLIESKAALKDWLSWVKAWYRKHSSYLYERRRDNTGRWWWAHPRARRVFFGLLKITQTCFKFLSHPLMPKTTNCLEASIGVISDKKRIHRGLRRFRQPQFVQWYVYFYNQKLLSSKK